MLTKVNGGTLLVLLGAVTGEFSRLHLAAISLKSLLGLLYLIGGGSLIGFTAYTWLLRVAPTSLVSTYAYVNPLVALVMGALIGNEALSGRSLLAAAVIIGSVALTTTSGSKAQPKPQIEETAAEP